MRITSKKNVESRHRLIIITDMENEEDDSQTMVRLLMYSNEIDIEGLIAVTSGSEKTRHESFVTSIIDRIQAYGLVRDNLMKHSDGWPTEEYLMSKAASGPQAFGMEGVGEGFTTDGVELIINAVDKEDERPIYVAINAGANCLAQALWVIDNTRTKEEKDKFIKKIRVYDNTGQDNCGAWILNRFPDLFYIRSQSQITAFYGPDGDIFHQLASIKDERVNLFKPAYSKEPKRFGPNVFGDLSMFDWTEIHVRRRHGILGALYPHRMMCERVTLRFMEGGGATSWIGLVNKGLYDPEKIDWGGWGGRFETEKEYVPPRFTEIRESEKEFLPIKMYKEAKDTWSDCEGNEYIDNIYAPVWRWRQAYTNDFQARMDWCVDEYNNANHHPVAVLFDDEKRNIVCIEAKSEETITLDASKSYDPDGDEIIFKWYQYKEPSTYKEDIELKISDQSNCSITLPKDAKGKQIHVILEVSDVNPIVSLTSYRRIVIDVM